ncbi:hypothetical protein ACPZ19_44920 [Amycolatopsis lurida]
MSPHCSNSTANAQVLPWFAADVEPAGFGEPPRIAVGRQYRAHHHVPAADPRTREGEVLGGEPLIRERYPEIEPYLAGLRSWMHGNLDWSASTRRYREALHDTENPASYLEAALIDRSAA